MLSNAYFLAKFRFDTAENEPAKLWQKIEKIAKLVILPTLLLSAASSRRGGRRTRVASVVGSAARAAAATPASAAAARSSDLRVKTLAPPKNQRHFVMKRSKNKIKNVRKLSG